MPPVPFSCCNLGGRTHIGTEFAIKQLNKYWGTVTTKAHSTYYGNCLARFYDKHTGKPRALYVIHTENPKTGETAHIVGDSLAMVKWTYTEWIKDWGGLQNAGPRCLFTTEGEIRCTICPYSDGEADE